jgi:hypothetical protein
MQFVLKNDPIEALVLHISRLSLEKAGRIKKSPYE